VPRGGYLIERIWNRYRTAKTSAATGAEAASMTTRPRKIRAIALGRFVGPSDVLTPFPIRCVGEGHQNVDRVGDPSLHPDWANPVAW